MLLGKRPRPPMKRTTSMTEITAADDPRNPFPRKPTGDSDPRLFSSVVSPRPHRRHSSDLTHSNFLRSCGLCKRRLVPGRDIYMYRGDSAFCSSECRQKQMNQDERTEKCSVASTKPSETSTGAAVKMAETETVAAV